MDFAPRISYQDQLWHVLEYTALLEDLDIHDYCKDNCPTRTQTMILGRGRCRAADLLVNILCETREHLVDFINGIATTRQVIENLSCVQETRDDLFHLISTTIALLCFVVEQSFTVEANALSKLAELVSGTVLNSISYNTQLSYEIYQTDLPDDTEVSRWNLEYNADRANQAHQKCSALALQHYDERPVENHGPKRLFLSSYEPALLGKFPDLDLAHQYFIECVWKAMTLQDD